MHIKRAIQAPSFRSFYPPTLHTHTHKARVDFGSLYLLKVVSDFVDLWPILKNNTGSRGAKFRNYK